jgi:hypothetical protein
VRAGESGWIRNPVACQQLRRQAELVSKTTPFEYRDRLFWVYDVWESFLFAEMADIAAQEPGPGRTPWLAELERKLRVDAIIGASFAVLLDEWCDGHEDEFIALATRAARQLAARGAITAQQAAAWIVLDGTPVRWRGKDPVDTAPIAGFVGAMADIIRGVYPAPPDGLHWYFNPDGVRAI